MEIQVSQVNTLTILELSGRFDAYNASSVEAQLKSIAEKTPAYALVNLSGVHFVDSTGLATLVQGMKRCRQQNGDVYLCCLQQPVRIIFELTRFDMVFKIFDTQEDAVEACFLKVLGGTYSCM